MHDARINGLAVRAKHSDFAGEEIEFYEVQVVGGTVAALYQQVIIGAPHDFRNTTAPHQQCFVGFKRVASLFPAEMRFPSTRAIVGHNPYRHF